MGFNIVKYLSKEDYVEKIKIVDINVEIVKKKIKEEKIENVEIIKLNVNNENELIKFLKNNDVAIGAIGPFYEYAKKVMHSAIKAGINYLDICDDYDGTRDSLKLYNEAKNQNVTCITGLGWTPGLSNIIAKFGYEEMKKVNEIKIYWIGSAADSKGLAVIMHLFYSLTGKIPQFIDGKTVYVNAGTEKEIVNYPRPFGNSSVYYTGHPEPITIPLYLKVKTVKIKGGLNPDWQNKLAKIFVNLRLTKTHRRRKILAKFIHKIEDLFRSGGIEASGLRVDLIKNEEIKSFGLTGRMGKLTALPSVIGAKWLVNKNYEKGVYAPEGIIEAKEFLKEIIKKEIKIYEYKENEWKEIKI